MIKKIVALLMAVTACFLTACNGGESSGSSNIIYTPEEITACAEHECTKIRAKAATCETEGNIEYWACYRCEKLFTDASAAQEISEAETVLPKISHTPVYVGENESTCATKGNIPYWYCSSCYTYFEDEGCQLEIASKGSVLLGKAAHTLSYTKETTPSGYVNGNISYWHCSECKGYFSDEKGIREISKEETVILSAYNIPDFTIEVEAGRDPIVLQLTDPQIMEMDRVDQACYQYIREVITATNPDLIIITGDIIYGKFDDNGKALLSFINFMESFEIPWAPIFGNHDNESNMGADWQCKQLENAQHCLFEQKKLTGNGNYSVAIAQGGKIKRVFYMLDTNGCGSASQASLDNGHTVKEFGLFEDQIEWYTNEILTLREVQEDFKISFAYHAQAAVFGKVFEANGFKEATETEEQTTVNLDLINGAEGFGYIGRPLKNPWDADFSIFNGMKLLGADSIFVGHEHCNSISVVYEGVRFQFGQKSSEYDRFNCIDENGVISVADNAVNLGTKALIGGTVILLDKENASIKDSYIYYCGYTDGKIDWDKWIE